MEIYDPLTERYESLETKILNFVRSNFTASCAEIESAFGSGEYVLSAPYFVERNIDFWFSFSREVVISLGNLLKDKKIRMSPCDEIIYYYDGKVPSKPIAKDLKRHYQENRWCPVLFRIVNKQTDVNQK